MSVNEISDSGNRSGLGAGFRRWAENCRRRPMLEVISRWEDFPARLHGGVLTIGNFDGVHRGHQIILKRLVDLARHRGCPSIVFTFSPHPIAILRPEFAPVPLSDFQYRGRLLAQYGVDVMVVCRTSPDLLGLEYDTFFQQVVRTAINPVQMIEGPNFYFGRNREGNPDRLSELCQRSNIELEIVKPLMTGMQVTNNEMVSSSVIRQQLMSGNIQFANQALGHRFQTSGTVVSGDGRGRTMATPTANLTGVRTLVPCDGVYAGIATIAAGRFPAAINVGAPVTFGQTDRRIEVHLVGYEGDLYGQSVQIEWLDRLRDIKAFASPTELKQQIERDIQATKELVAASDQDE